MSDSLTTRIQQAGEVLGVSRNEIAKEIARLADTDDKNGLTELFDAYYQWENKGTPQETPDETRERCLSNFYVVAQIADCIRIADGDETAAIYVVWNGDRNIAGHSATFFKDVLEYEPPVDGQS